MDVIWHDDPDMNKSVLLMNRGNFFDGNVAR